MSFVRVTIAIFTITCGLWVGSKMPLNAVTMKNNLLAALNTKTYTDPQTGETRRMFNIPTPGLLYPLTAPYVFINSACTQFVNLWITLTGDMLPGLGPPPVAPPGTYNHAHYLTGAGLPTRISTYISAMTSDLLSSNLYVAGQGGWELFVSCWCTHFLTAIDTTQQLTTDIVDGAVLHTHSWVLLPDPATIKTQIISCMASVVINPFDPLCFFVPFVEELSKEFIRAIEEDSVLVPTVGANHIHFLT